MISVVQQQPARRRHTQAFREQVLAECGQAGASVAGVAIRHGVNPNLVHKWRRKYQPGYRRRRAQASSEDFVRLPMPSLAEQSAAAVVNAPVVATVRMDLPTPRGTLTVHWPISELGASVAWLRALTR